MGFAPLLSPPSAAGLFAAVIALGSGRAGREEQAKPDRDPNAPCCQQQRGGPFRADLPANGGAKGFDVGDTTKRANRATKTKATMTCHTRLTLIGNSS